MLDFSKTFCDLHPNQLISNFCSKQQCLVGLCATCICSHTESHVMKNTHPEYENIRTTYTKMQECIRDRISCLEIEKQRINRIIEAIQLKKVKITEAVELARSQSLDFINKFFDSKQKEFIRKMEAEDKKVGLHSESRMEALLNLISRDLNTLFTSAQDLSSQNFLESYQRIKVQILVNSVELQKDISFELQRNQKYEVNAVVNPMYINDVKNALEKSINLSFSNEGKTINMIQKINEQSMQTPIHPLVEEQKKQSRVWFQQPPIQQVQTQAQVQAQTHVQAQAQAQTHQPTYQKVQQPVYQYIQRAQSQPRMSYQSRPISSYMGQPLQQITSQINHRMNSPPQQCLTRRPQEVYLMHSSYQQQQQPSMRTQTRGISTQKCIKQNIGRHITYPSFVDTNYSANGNQNSQFSINHSIDVGKKIKKSGLSVMKNIQNQGKTSCS